MRATFSNRARGIALVVNDTPTIMAVQLPTGVKVVYEGELEELIGLAATVVALFAELGVLPELVAEAQRRLDSGMFQVEDHQEPGTPT